MNLSLRNPGFVGTLKKFSIADLPSLMLWLQAEGQGALSGDDVNTWTKSGGSTSDPVASMAAPKYYQSVYNGFAAVRFNSADATQLTHGCGDAAAYTVIALVKNGTSGGATYKGIFAAGTGSGIMLLQNAGADQWGTYAGGAYASGTIIAGNALLLTMIERGAAGGEFRTERVADGAFPSDSNGQAVQHLGGLLGQSGDFDLLELVVCGEELSLSQIEAAENDICERYGHP